MGVRAPGVRHAGAWGRYTGLNRLPTKGIAMPRILIAVDGSELSLDAVHHVLQLAQGGLRVDCVLANVQEPA